MLALPFLDHDFILSSSSAYSLQFLSQLFVLIHLAPQVHVESLDFLTQQCDSIFILGNLSVGFTKVIESPSQILIVLTESVPFGLPFLIYVDLIFTVLPSEELDFLDNIPNFNFTGGTFLNLDS